MKSLKKELVSKQINDEYKNSLEFEANYAMNSNVNTSDYIRKVFKKYD